MKYGVCKLKGVRRNNEQGIYHIRSEEGDWSHILRCAGRKIWRHQILDKRFRFIDAEICIRRIKGWKKRAMTEIRNIYNYIQ
jgi:hypothetical protein